MTVGQAKLEKVGFRRRIEIEMIIGADSWPDLLRALMEIEAAIQEERLEYMDIVSGGCNAGWTLNGDVDADWCETKYTAALAEYVERKRKR